MARPARSRRRPGPAADERRVAFVLSGGGNLGAMQVGMLRALVERRIQPDVVLGCSAGAINGAGFASNPSRAGVRRLEELWARVTEFEVMPSSWVPSTVQLARRGASIHANDGLRRLIEFGLTVATFDELPLRFECVATDVDSAEEVWFDRGALADAILASAALPTVFPPVERDGRRYLDGGIVNDIPVNRAVQLGATRIYVLHVGLRGGGLPEPRRPLDVALWTYWLARRARYQRDRAAIGDGVELIELAPPQRPSLRFDDFARSDELIRQGYQVAVAALDTPAPAGP
ncbi:MAG: patatin-like phospholipase family protein [Acidimicrobiia bacterium]